MFIVIGFPHDRAEHLRETSRLRATDRRGRDHRRGAVAFYMALPGTQLFDSLYDGGKVAIDRTYFRHILEGLDPVVPLEVLRRDGRSTLFGGGFGWSSLLRRLGRRVRPAPHRAATREVFGRSGDASKLQTALRVMLKNTGIAVAVKVGRRWMPRREERRMFAGWDALYRDVVAGRHTAGVESDRPFVATDLHAHNVVDGLRLDHESTRAFRLPQPAVSVG